MKKNRVVVLLLMVLSSLAWAQKTTGTVVSVSGYAEVKAENDQATATFFIEEQDQDRLAAAARVNRQIQAGTELLKQADPQGTYATRGYYSYPVYTGSAKSRTLTGWRIGQYLELTTKNLRQLPATAAAVQQILLLNGLAFSLSHEAREQLEAKRIEAAYQNLHQRVQLIAKALGRDAADATIESLDFNVDNNGLVQPRMFAAAAMSKASAVPESSFEAGVSTLSANVNAKIKWN